MVVLLPGAFYFAVKDQIGIVSALMGIFVLSVLTLSLPRLRLIEAFGIKGELAEAVRKAELTLEQFKRLARSSARQGFQQMKTGNGRYLPFVEKRGTIAALNDSMEAAGLDENEKAELRRPLFEALAIDLLSPVQTAAVHLKVKRIRAIEAELRGHETAMPGNADPNETTWAGLRVEKRRLMDGQIPSLREETTPGNLGVILDSCAGTFPRTADEDRRLLAVIASAKRIMAECQEAQNVTPDSNDFLELQLRVYPGVFHNDDSEVRADGLLRSRFA